MVEELPVEHHGKKKIEEGDPSEWGQHLRDSSPSLVKGGVFLNTRKEIVPRAPFFLSLASVDGHHRILLGG